MNRTGTFAGEPEVEGGVVQLACDPASDGSRGRLARALNAEFAVETAVRRRRACTAALALTSVPASLAMIFPALGTPVLRRTNVAVWLVSLLAMVANLWGEVRAARAARHLRRQLLMHRPRTGGGMR